MNIGDMLRRIVGVFAFSSATYKEIEHDKTLGREAMVIVGIASALSGLGLMLFNSTELGETAQMPLVRLALGVIGALFVYLLWAGIVSYMGSSYFGATTNVREMRRVLGYGYAPVALGVLAGLNFGLLPWFVGYVWAMLTGIVGARIALDVSWSRTIGTVIVAMVIGVLFFSFIAFMIGFPMYAFIWG
jgi:hypothetical protein